MGQLGRQFRPYSRGHSQSCTVLGESSARAGSGPLYHLGNYGEGVVAPEREASPRCSGPGLQGLALGESHARVDQTQGPLRRRKKNGM